MGSPPWANIANFRLDSAESYTTEDMDRFLSIFFGADDYREIRDAGLDDDMKAVLFLDVMGFVGERMPESLVPKAAQMAQNGVKPGRSQATAKASR